MNESIESKLARMEVFLKTAQTEGAKFDKGNKAAGTRVRGAMQEIKKLAQEVRESVSEIKNAE